MLLNTTKRIIAFVYLYLFLGIGGIYAQNIKFEHYNDNDGLSHNSVRHILQDKNGFLWLGTFSGLNRFDGYQFKAYTTSSSTRNELQNDDITALELDSDSNQLWVGTRNGLSRFEMNTHTFTTFLPDAKNTNSLADHEIRSIHIDQFKRVWVGTRDKGLFIYHPKKNTFEKVDLQKFNYIKEIFEDSKGNIWVGSYKTASIAKITLDEKGTILNSKSYNLPVPTSKEKNPYVNFIYEDSKADIFVGSREGLYKLSLSNDSFENLYIEDNAIRDKIGPHFISIAKAPDGKYWLGTLGGILVVEQLEDLTQQDFEWYYSELSDDDSLVDDLISSLFFDASGVLWIGTEDGFDKYDPFENQFKTNKDISKHIENQMPRIRGFSKTHDGKIVVATRHNGLFISENDKHIPLFNGQLDIASIQSFDGKTFYCGLWNGEILAYDYLKRSSKIFNVGFSQSPVLAFANTGDNKMVIGAHGEGAVTIDMKTFETIDMPGASTVDKTINKIVVDDIGQIWFATQLGVFRYDPVSKITTSYAANSDSENGLLHNNVSDLTIDKNGKIWAATRKGLNYYDVKLNDFEPATVPEKLHGKWITDVVSDSKNTLWLNLNNNQVGRYNTESFELKTYRTNSGNRLDVFSLSGFYYDDDSNIYLCGKNGIISFSPENLKDNNYSPLPIITNVSIQNKAIEVGSILNDQKILEYDINEKRELQLKNANKNFAFSFSSPSYVNERFNNYSYMLEGFDESWNTVDAKQRTVQYTNLFFGDYTFKVKAMNSHGIWSEASEYKVSISPPFWLTYKAFLLALALILVVLYLARREIKNRLKLKQALLVEKLKQERNEKLNSEKFRFFTNISHELRTPLTLILGPAKDLLQQASKTQNEFQESRSKLIHQNANRLLNLVNQILDFRKAQTGELNLKVTELDILERSKTIFHSFEDLAKNKQVSFNFNSESESIFGWIDKDKLDKILYNLLSNAIKFTNKHGNVDLFLGYSDDSKYLVIEVSDTGIGIPEASQKNIFSRFYQTRNSKENNTGSGIGLSLVKSLVTIHKGEINLKSKPGEGTIFSLTLPIGREFFDDNEVQEFVTAPESEELQLNKPKKKRISTTHLKQKIVIIEDNDELRSYLVDYLSDYYKVFSAVNGKEGLHMCRQIKPILCIADVMMPVMNGIEFCQALKTDEFISHIPVILLTALSENEDKAKGYNAGADGYLVKPFDPSLLKTRIANIITSRIELKTKFSGEVESEISLLTHSPLDEDFMKKVTQLIDDHITENSLTTSFLCRELGMSTSKLYRKIKELTDLAPNEFIRTVRLKRSAILLKTKKYNVSEVTDLIGFNDPLYFSRCFKKQFGYPPSALIKNEASINAE